MTGFQIREYTGDSLTKVFDCISEGDSPKICCDAISSKGGVISYLLQAKHDREDVENKHTLGYTVTGESFEFRSREMPAKPEDFEFGKKYDTTTVLTCVGVLTRVQIHRAQHKAARLISNLCTSTKGW